MWQMKNANEYLPGLGYTGKQYKCLIGLCPVTFDLEMCSEFTLK